MRAFSASLRVGAARRWKGGITTALTALGAVWLLTEIVTFISDDAKAALQGHPWWYSLAAVAIAAVAFVVFIYEPRRVLIRVPTTDTCIEIKYGNLFNESDHLLIAVNEFFDGSLGQRVAPQSVHGQFIQRFFQSDELQFRAAIDRAIVERRGKQTRRTPPPDVAYPCGTTAVVDIGGRKAFLFVLTRTDLTTAKASTDVPSFWSAVSGALEAAHHFGNGRPIALPLVGNGLSGLNLPPQHLLRMLALCLVYYARAKYLPKQVTLVLPEQCFEHLDLSEIERDWRS